MRFGNWVTLVGLGLGVWGCAPAGEPRGLAVAPAEAELIFGSDDRKQYYQHTSEWLRERGAHSAMALIGPGNLDQRDPRDVRIKLTVKTVGEVHDLCESVPFREEPAAANCSATLIAPDLVLTAGHCLGDASDCSSFAFVFGYRYDAADELAHMTAEDVYACKRRIVYDESDLIDHAIMQLDRPVHPRYHPAPVRFEDMELAKGTPVATASFGQGIPLKLDDQGKVTNNAVDMENGVTKYFETTLDTFPGSSGAGVYTHDGRVAGVHVRGAESYLANGSCTVLSMTYDDINIAQGGDASHVARAMDDLCATTLETPLCPGEDSLCKPCEACAVGESCGNLPGDADTTYCAATCEDTAECDAGLSCQEGECLPAPRCFGGNEWSFDACGRPLELVTACADDEVCPDGESVCRPAGKGNACDDAESLPTDPGTEIEGTLGDDYRSNFLGSCGGLGQDRVWKLELDVRSDVRLEAAGFDTVLYLRTDCGDAESEVVCRDDSTPPGGGGSRIETTLDAGTYFVVLDSDGFKPKPGGDFTLSVDVEPVADGDAPDAGDDGGEPGGSGAAKDSGGCSMVRGPRRERAVWVWFVLAGAVVGWRRRRHSKVARA
ncbi:MAG: serine protease [Polyangiales bacterium]